MIDIDRDAAHEAAQQELAKSIYPKPSLTEQIFNWIEDLLYRLIANTAQVPGGWFTIAVLLILVAIAIVVAVRIARRAMRSSGGDSQTLFGATALSAAEHRATAERYAAEGDWAPAIRHRVRAVARRLEENGILDPVPGRTATELARAAGRAVPVLADELSSAADTFNDVGPTVNVPAPSRSTGLLPRWTTGWAAMVRPRRRVGRTPLSRSSNGPRCDDVDLSNGRRRDGDAANPRPAVVLFALVVIVGVAALSTWLTAPRPGGRMDPRSTSADGGHALVALLRDRGVDVIEADTIDIVEREARSDTLLLVADTYFLSGDELFARLTDLPGDRLLIEPSSPTRQLLSPEISRAESSPYGGIDPNCDLREATRAGTVQFGAADAYEATGTVPVTRCYGGLRRGTPTTMVLHHHRRRQRRIHDELGAARGGQRRARHESRRQPPPADLVRTAAQRRRWLRRRFGGSGGPHPSAGGLDGTAARAGRGAARAVEGTPYRPAGCRAAARSGARASETVEGRGRLYRSRRARDRAAEALRTSTLQRMLPRLGLGPTAQPPEVVQAVAQRCGLDPRAIAHTLYGPPPGRRHRPGAAGPRTGRHRRQVAQS